MKEEEKGKLIKISEIIALLQAKEFISRIYRGNKKIYPKIEKTEAEKISGIAGIRRV
ncbi:MAG: hypothetical protein WBC21_00665 [Minisyncoccales bacterium]